MSVLWMKCLALVMLALALVGGGWVVRGWHDKAAQADLAQAKLDAAAKQALQLNQTNQLTAQGMAALLTSLEAQAHAFAQIDAYLAAHPMGSCTFDPATDGVWNSAYDAAFGAHQAAGGHGAAGRPAAATVQHEPAH